MDPDLMQALSNQLLAAADDELILGHRDSEWTGHAPILEEDIAFANIAQDEIGHAIIWYSLLAELTGHDPDRQVFFRDAEAYRNVQLVELPRGDWAFSMVRQYLFDAAEMVRLADWVNSRYQPLADAAAKIRKEEIYHYRHTHTWVQRLGLGTDESHRRTQNALDEMWPYVFQLFAALPGQALLIQAGIVSDPRQVCQEWEARVLPSLKESGLQVPAQPDSAIAQRHQHTLHLTELLAEMQQVARLDPEAQW